MITPTGQLIPLDGEWPGPPGSVIVSGTQENLEAMATKVRLGHAEKERRKARRRQQRTSRRTNRA